MSLEEFSESVPELIRMLDITECIVTIDAAGCQKSIADALGKT